MTTETKAVTVRELRRKWKKYKSEFHDHPTGIRFHRACSWIQKAEQAQEAGDSDIALISKWIGLNSLYGQWDPDRSEPKPDINSWRHFFDTVRSIDQDKSLEAVLIENRKLVLAIFDDSFIMKYFWGDPSPDQARRTTSTRHKANTWFQQKRYALILETVVDRIYFLRCQIMHGAATYNSKLNRDSIRRCNVMLNHIIYCILDIFIKHGRKHDWGAMCFRPQK